jgi:hypothetical protein
MVSASASDTGEPHLHTKADVIDRYDAAGVERRGAKTKIVKRHETPTRVAACPGRGRAGHRTRRCALPVRAVGGGLLAGTAGGGAILGAVAATPPRA